MTRSKRSLALVALVALALTLAARNDAVVKAVGDLLGPRVALFMPARASLQTDGAHDPHAAVSEAAVTAAPARIGTASSAVVTLGAQPGAKPELGYVLEAKLVAANGTPFNETTVRFYDVLELLGPREMLIGSTTTDGAGLASMAYLPARTGTHEIVVRSAERPGQAPADGRTVFEATVAAPAYAVARSRLADFSAGIPLIVGVVVLAVWAVIGFAALGSARGIAAEGSLAKQKEEAIEARSRGSARGVATPARAATGKEKRS